MIVIDTDVLSETLRPQPDAAVRHGAGLATRDVDGFEGTEVVVPWEG